MKAELEVKIDSMMSALEHRIDSVRSGLKGEIDSVRSGLERKIESLRSDILKFLIGAVGLQTVVIIGALTALACLIK